MVHGVELFFALFNNLAIFIALITLYGYLLNLFEKLDWLKLKTVIGFSFGLFAIGCMHAKIPVFEGVIVDQRNTIIALSGAFGGPISAVISAIIAGGFRMYLGGDGAFAGVIGVCLSAISGTILNRFPGCFFSVKKAAMSSLFATIMIVPGFLFVNDLQTGWNLMKKMAFPYGFAIFFGIFMVGLLLRRVEDNISFEQAFRESEERLDLALSGANEGLWDWCIDQDILHFDSRYYMIAGYEPNEFPAEFSEWEKRVHPDDIEQTKSSISQYLSGNLKNYDVEFRFLRKTGDYMWIHGKGKIVARNEKGKPIRFVGTHADISKRKQIEQSLRFTQFSFDKAAMGIYYIDSNAKISNVNEQAAKNLGYTIEELSRMSIFDIDPLVNKDNWGEIWQSLCNLGRDNFETTHKRKDGKQVPVEIASNLLEYEGQKFSIAFVLDIADRKKAENELKKLRNYLSNVINSMPSVLIGVDIETNVTQWNRRAEKRSGISSEKAVGKPVGDVLPRLSPHMSKIRKSSVSKEIQHISKEVNVKESGEICYEDITIYPLISNGAEGAVIRIDDVTEKIKMEEVLIQNEKMLSVGGLAAGMAHEINNPLSGMIQNSQVLANRLTSKTIPANIKTAESLGTTVETIQEFMNRRDIPRMAAAISNSGLRIASIVKNMLDFARQSDSSFSSHDPVALMESILALASTEYNLKKKYDFKSIKIEKEYGSHLPLLACESGKIQQVLLNLLNNGAYAMHEKAASDNLYQPQFILRLFHEAESGMLCMEVEDNGPGMDDEIKKKVFDPFFTTKPVGEGTGLGLSVSYFIITENHKGTMTVESEPQKGTKFIIRLPVERNHS